MKAPKGPYRVRLRTIKGEHRFAVVDSEAGKPVTHYGVSDWAQKHANELNRAWRSGWGSGWLTRDAILE